MSECIDHGKSRSLLKEGYALVKRDGKMRLYHRVVYVRHHGIAYADIDGQVIRHSCDNPRCINPEHLLVGSRADNVQDKVDRGREARKISKSTVEQIRREYVPRSKHANQYVLAAKYGVAQSRISQIIEGA